MVLTRIMRTAVFIAWLAPALATAADPVPSPVQPCAGQTAVPLPDGRLFGHIPYAEALSSDLVLAPAGFAIGPPCHVQRDVLPDLVRLIAAATAPEIGGRLHAVSCFRSIAHQRAVFCSQIGPRKACKDAAERARSVGPPGYSEHSSGYAIDFVARPAPGCADVDPCIAATAAGRWLIGHAADYGFELSFPDGNAQGVTWEPWHWRWVGTSIDEPGAARARLTLSRARAQFAALPAVPDQAVTPEVEPTLPQPIVPPDAPN
ncbi:MAG: M15 family metallopeptidase [Sphingomonas sp.]